MEIEVRKEKNLTYYVGCLGPKSCGLTTSKISSLLFEYYTKLLLNAQ